MVLASELITPVSTGLPCGCLAGLPRQPVGDAEYAIGFYASALVRDGGTLQIGIGALSDALTVRFGTEALRYSAVIVACFYLIATVLAFVAVKPLRKDWVDEPAA